MALRNVVVAASGEVVGMVFVAVFDTKGAYDLAVSMSRSKNWGAKK